MRSFVIALALLVSGPCFGQTLEERVAQLEAKVAALSKAQVTASTHVEDPSIPDPILRQVFAFRRDHRHRNAFSQGYHEWGGRPKDYLRGGFYSIESGDTVDLGSYFGHYDLTKIGPASILPPPTLYSALAYIHAGRVTGYPPKPEGRSIELALKHGAFAINIPRSPGHDDPDFNIARSVVTVGPPEEFNNAWRHPGIGVHIGFWSPRTPPATGWDIRTAPILLGRPNELPPNAFIMYMQRP